MERYNVPVGSKESSLASYGEVEVDWLEDDDAHTFKFNLPGLRAKDVKVQIINDSTLQVSGVWPIGERSLGTWRSKERPVGSFRRSFDLHGEVYASQVKAFDGDGVLIVRVPKKKPFVRTIPIGGF